MKPHKGHGPEKGKERGGEQQPEVGAEEARRQRLEKEREILSPERENGADAEVPELGSPDPDSGSTDES